MLCFTALRIHQVTKNVISSLDTLSRVAHRIRDALCSPAISWMDLCSYGEELANTATNATNYMRGVQYISEKLYYTYATMSMAIQFLWITSLIGLAMMGAGIALIIKARRKERRKEKTVKHDSFGTKNQSLFRSILMLVLF